MRGEVWLSSVWQGWLMEDLKMQKKTKLPLCIDQAKTDGAVALVYGKCK